MNTETTMPCGCASPSRVGWSGLIDPASELLLRLDGSWQLASGFPHESELIRGLVCRARRLEDLLEPPLAMLLIDRAQVVHGAGEPSSIDVSLAQPHDRPSLAARVRISPEGSGVLLLLRRASAAAGVDPSAPSTDESFWQLFDAAPIPLTVETATYPVGEGVSRHNRKFTAVFGYDASDVPSVQHWWPLAYPDPVYREQVRSDWFRRVREAAPHGEAPTMETTVVCKDGSRRDIEFGLSVIGDRHVVSFVDLTEARQNERALAARVDELRAALEEIKQLRMLMPICAWCHKLRDDRGYWLAVEEFLTLRSDVTVTHGICPECRLRHLTK